MRKFFDSLSTWLKSERSLLFPDTHQIMIQKPQQTKTTKKQTISLILILVVLCFGAWLFYSNIPTGINTPVYILPPNEDAQTQIYEQVINFVKSDNTDRIPYGVGFNCVDASLKLWRDAEWKGIAGDPIVIQFVDQPIGHMVVGFPTEDRGDIFIEPQNGKQIIVGVGLKYLGYTIKGFYYWDMVPEPLDGSPPYDYSVTPK